MRSVNVRKLHERTGALVDLAAEGQVLIIVKRGKPVAELRPLDASTRRRTLPDRTNVLARYPELKGDSGRFLEEDRS
jgi:prevent-host-death family protein